jgi:hypothetical protein
VVGSPRRLDHAEVARRLESQPAPLQRDHIAGCVREERLEGRRLVPSAPTPAGPLERPGERPLAPGLDVDVHPRHDEDPSARRVTGPRSPAPG